MMKDSNGIMTKTSERTMQINIGPQHPSTHGVLRMLVTLSGEQIIKIEPIIGYLHRGMEKMAESRTYLQYLPIVDRIDYLSGFFCSYAYISAIENLINTDIPIKAKYIRTLTMEMNRISSHLLWLGCYLLDLGATSPLFYTFIEREKILNIFEDLTGSRMMYNYYTFGGVKRDIEKELLIRIKNFSNEFLKAVREYEDLITNNPIFITRTKDIGILSKEDATEYSITGANLRACSIPKDLRKDSPYLIYNNLEFSVPIGTISDSHSRYLMRIKEMKESNKIINQCTDWLLSNIEDNEINTKINPLTIKPTGTSLSEVESTRGLLQCYIEANGTEFPNRIKWRTPSFYATQAINTIAKGFMLPDLMAIFGSLDIIMPEVDR